MNRRFFLTGAAALIGGLAIEQAIPFGRVWSFPSKIVPVTLKFHREAFVITGLWPHPTEPFCIVRSYDIHREIPAQRIDMLYSYPPIDDDVNVGVTIEQ